MKEKIRKEEAIKVFSSSKKTEKLLDKTLSKTGYEYLIKAEEKGLYSIFSGKGEYEICKSDDVLKCFMGVLYFEFGIGKDNMPVWAMHSGFANDGWESISSQVQPTDKYQNLNTALDNGASLYCTNLIQSGENNFVLTNSFNENYADKILVKDTSFSDGLNQVESVAQLVVTNMPSQEQ